MRECRDILICAVFTARERRAHPKEKRPRIARTDDWQTIKQRSLWPEQVTYDMIRPVVLFSETTAERANETGEARRSLYRRSSSLSSCDLLVCIRAASADFVFSTLRM